MKSEQKKWRRLPAGFTSHPHSRCSPTPAELPAKRQGDSPIQDFTCHMLQEATVGLALACNNTCAAWADWEAGLACGQALQDAVGIAQLHEWIIPAAFPRQTQTASSTLAAYSVSLYPDSSDRDLADDWALNFLLLCLGSQSCRKHSALLESLWLNKTCEDFWQMLMHYPNKLVEHTSEPA